MPSLATGVVKSVADLISLFRTDRTITQSTGTVDEKALDTLLAGVLMTNHPSLRIFNPDQFVPEYEIGIGERSSFYDDLTRLSMADAYLDSFLSEMTKAGVDKAAPSTITRLVASGTRRQSSASRTDVFAKASSGSSGTAGCFRF